MYANHGEESTPRNNPLFTEYTFWAVWSFNMMEINLCMPGNKSIARNVYGFSYGTASASVRRSRLAKAALVRKWNWKYHKDSYMNAFNKPCSFLSHTSKLSSARPITNCLAASNGVCTKRNTAIRSQVMDLVLAGLISHLALCGLSACIGHRWLIVLALAIHKVATGVYAWPQG